VASRSILHLLAPNLDIAKLVICPNNTPVIVTTRPDAFAFDIRLGEWTVIVNHPGHPHSLRGNASGDGLLAAIEKEVARLSPALNGATRSETELSDNEAASILMGQKALRMNAARLLGSTAEYELHVGDYAGAIKEPALATDLIQDLVRAITEGRT